MLRLQVLNVLINIKKITHAVMKLSSGQQESIVSLFKCVDENNIEVIRIGNHFVMHPFSNASCYEHRCLLLNSIVDRTSEMYAFSYNHVDIALYSF